MPDLYVLGAGCSKNYSNPRNRIPGLSSPTDRDFFQKARLVIEKSGIRSNPQFVEDIFALIKTLAPMYGSKDDSLSFLDNPDLSLEQVMTLLDIDSKLFSPESSTSYSRGESPEIRALKNLLVWTLDHALEGPPCQRHRALAERMRPHDIVLSFNYDILIDNALYASDKMTDAAYGMNFYKVDEDGTLQRPNDEKSDVSLFKLHGSLNWIRCRVCGSLLLYRYRKQIMLGAIAFQCPRCMSDSDKGQRVIVPPIQSKDYDRDIAYLWFQADRAIKDISRMISIGYSFPVTDFDMLSLMRRFRARQRTPDLVFVSPDLEAEARLKNIFGTSMTTHFNDLQSYLKSAQ